jgi:Uma2 family endonuclease
MSVALRHGMSLAEFLAWEAGQDLRYEFDGFRPVGMTGGTRAHAMLQANLMAGLHGRLRGGPCRVFGSDLKVEVAGSIRYPDAFIVCTGGANDSLVVQDPVVIFEVLSPSTASTDRITKNREYAATPSVLRYVMLEQDRIAATVFARIEGEWRGYLVDAADTLHLPEIGHELPLAVLYEGMDLAADPDAMPGDA